MTQDKILAFDLPSESDWLVFHSVAVEGVGVGRAGTAVVVPKASFTSQGAAFAMNALCTVLHGRKSFASTWKWLDLGWEKVPKNKEGS